MKGDFSWFDHRPHDNFTGVLEQQGRVRLDRDGLAAEEIARSLRTLIGRDAFGPGRVAVPAEEGASFRVTGAASDGASVSVTYAPGRAWIDGIPLRMAEAATAEATYLPPPFQPPVGPDSIAAGVRDAVVLEVWEDAVSAFQYPETLLEPALGGVDTTERVRACHRLRLRRLEDDEDCATIGPSLRDDPDTIGRLTVTPAPAIAIAGDCPVEAGGGYTGDGHRLFCIEVAAPRGGGPRFTWSRHGGGLVGRGRLDPVAETISITHNRPMIDAANVSGFLLQALAPEPGTGCWRVVYEATVSMTDDLLSVTDPTGTWPTAAGEHAFFRLWDGVGEIADFTGGPTDLADGIRLDFDPVAPGGSNYREGDRWLFPVRAAGTDFDPSNWPDDALPKAITYHRAPLAILTWSGPPAVEMTAPDDISDCRDSFPTLTDPCPCCTITVGDGRTTHGDEDSIEAAIARLPSSGGKICLLPGLHETNAVIDERANIRIVGCGKDSRVIPRPGRRDGPIIHLIDSECITLANMEMITLGGVAVLGESREENALRQVTIEGNRIVACVRAIQCEGGSEIVIRENRIRMLDKRGAGVAVYLVAEDSRIEDNDIGVVPAPATPRPPDNPDDPDETDDPNDPCADEDLIYGDIGFLITFAAFVLDFTLTAIVPPPYRALGGIQIGGGAARVGVLDNRILGGAGNGITLGGSHIPPDDGGVGGSGGPVSQTLSFSSTVLAIQGTVEDSDGNPATGVTLRMRAPSGAERSFTTDASGGFQIEGTGEAGVHTFEPVTPGFGIDEAEIVQIINLGAGSIAILRLRLNRQRDEADSRLGFVYAVRIEDNEITAMGLNGIGIPPALTVLEEDDDAPGGGISSGPGDLTSNAGLASAREPRFQRARAAAVNSLLARLGNPVVDLTILNNRIYGNLQTPFTAAMRDAARQLGFGGISLGLCDTVTIIANRIETNGRRHIDPVCGIFVLFGEQVEITDNLVRDNGPFVQTDAEVVAGQRGGIAGIFLSVGFDDFGADDNRGALTVKPAVRIHDNVVQQPMGRALTLLAAGPVSVIANHLSAERSGSQPLDVLAGTVMVISFSGIARLPSGGCLINSNQIALGPQSGAFTAVALAAGEDLGFDANQVDALQTGLRVGDRSLMLNTLIFAQTLRTTGNRFSEPLSASDLALAVSLLSLSTRMNIAGSNEGDHCIFAFDQGTPPRVEDFGNIEFDNALCREIRPGAAGAALNPILGTATLASFDFANDLQPATGVGQTYGAALGTNLVALNQHQRVQLALAAEDKSANAALLRNEIRRLEARMAVRDDLLEANRVRLALIDRDVSRLRAAEGVVSTKPVVTPDNDGDVANVIQGRVVGRSGVGIALAEVQFGDRRGRVIDILDPVSTGRKGGYELLLSNDLLEEHADVLKGGVTVIARLPDSDVKPAVSRPFAVDKPSVLVPDLQLATGERPTPVLSPLGPVGPVRPFERPILTSARRLSATSGRIAPLLRRARKPRDENG